VEYLTALAFGLGIFVIIISHHVMTGGSFIALPAAWILATAVGCYWDVLPTSILAVTIGTAIFSIPYLYGAAIYVVKGNGD
jgi:hypothetical protein